MRNLLRFIENSVPENVVDEATKEISEYVDKVKKSPEVEEAFMTMGDKIDQLCEESEQRGIEIGKQQMLNMIKEAAQEAGVSEEIEKLVNDCIEINK